MINSIWNALNSIRYYNSISNLPSIWANICAQVHLSSSRTLLSFKHDIYDFEILKDFQVNVNPHRSPLIKEIFLAPSPLSWLKANVDGSFASNSMGCDISFRKSTYGFALGFAKPLPWLSSLLVEFCRIFKCIKLASFITTFGSS